MNLVFGSVTEGRIGEYGIDEYGNKCIFIKPSLKFTKKTQVFMHEFVHFLLDKITFKDEKTYDKFSDLYDRLDGWW